MTQDEVVEAIKQETLKTSLRKVAARIGVSPAYLSDVVRGNRDVSDNIAAAFGFARDVVTTVKFRKKAL